MLEGYRSQARNPSVSAQTGTRLDYLEPVREEFTAGIKEYLGIRPDADASETNPEAGEELTLAAFDRAGVERLKAISAATQKNFDDVKKDAGRFAVGIAVELVGADRVWTAQTSSRVDYSRWPNLREVKKFTRHRVLPLQDRPARIILDTSVPRTVAEGRPGAIVLNALVAAKGRHPVSLADGAVAEFMYWFQTHADKAFPVWPSVAKQLDRVLDPDLPIAPGGHERAAMSGLLPFEPGYSAEGTRAYARTVWSFLRSRTSLASLNEAFIFTGLDGKRYTFDVKSAAAVLRPAGERWSSFIKRIGERHRPDESGETIEEKKLIHAIHEGLVEKEEAEPSKLARLDLMVQAIARRARDAGFGKYNPKPERSNDAIDLDLLLYAAFPAVICTADEKFVRIVRALRSKDTWRVMTPDELLKWLRTGEQPNVLQPIE